MNQRWHLLSHRHMDNKSSEVTSITTKLTTYSNNLYKSNYTTISTLEGQQRCKQRSKTVSARKNEIVNLSED